MTWVLIRNHSATWLVQPNVLDLDRTRTIFAWDQVRGELGGFADCFNIASLAIDRHAAGHLHGRVPLRWLGRDETILLTTYSQLGDQTNRLLFRQS